MTTEPATSSFIIATRNRPDYLFDTVQSLVEQTILPGELCIVDSSDLATRRAEIEEICDKASLSLDYCHPAASGLPRQRNIGIDRTHGDPVFLIDDDVLLVPDCHERILEEYATRRPPPGGVCAADTDPPRVPPASVMWRRIFGSGGWWPDASGRVRRGFFPEGISVSAVPREVEFFMGWFMSFRREVFERERFDEALSGYAYLEDIDFSYRVSRNYPLIFLPSAKGDHLKASASRLSRHQLLRMMIANHFYLHRKNMPQTMLNQAALWWAFLGLLILNSTRAVRFRNPEHVTGLLAGLREQARGKGLIDPAAEGVGR
ncbi:MAG: glycosyltransferase family 2 protein [Actinobacteria bacterium]|nr:glycosyltransferase family 2 protein [Actinomycetota bacterium]